MNAPEEISDHGGSTTPIAGFANLKVARLGCSPFVTDWSTEGPVYVFDEVIIPGGTYRIEEIDNNCLLDGLLNFSNPLFSSTSTWGDIARPFDPTTLQWPAPDGSVDATFDLLPMADKFTNLATAPSKPRTDLEPALPDRLVNITDLAYAVDSFRGLPYPFTPNVSPCP